MGRCGALEELIRRQRANLQGTFAQCEQPHPDKPTVERIAKTERELAEATAEFAAKLAEKAGPVPCLASAAQAMQSATAELDQKSLKPACGHEETALAELIKARQNLRQMLSQSSSANSCRQVDKEQQQKMRPPKQPRPQTAQKKPAADLQRQIEQLAKTERQCSQEIESQCAGRQGQSGQASRSPAKSDNLAERQEKAGQQAAELEQAMRDDEAMTELARQRMSRARRTIQSSAQNMRGGKQSEAGSQAKDAAEQLESLSQQVAGLKSPEMAGKLAAAEGLARRLAGQQRARQKQASVDDHEKSARTAKPDDESADQGQSGKSDRQATREDPAKDQRRAAEDARTLGDFLEQFQRDTSQSDAKLARALRDASEANPPGEIAEEMNRAAEALDSGRREEARREMQQTAERLDALAQQVGATRREFVQPQLEKLLAAEKQAAELQNRLSSPVDEQRRAEAEKKTGELETSLEPLRWADERIAEEVRKFEEVVHQRAGWSNWHEIRPGYYKPSDLSVVAIQRIAKALRVRIQEIILKDALLDQDSPVPPQYQKQVETYYRVLSEDLR